MKRFIVFVLVLSFLSSCDSFLNVKPKAEIVEHLYFETAEGFEDALYGVYASLSSPELYGENLSWGLLDAFAQYYRRESTDDRAKAILSLDHEKLRGSYNSIWNKGYESIAYVNNILRNLERKEKSSLRYYNLYKGEALGLRAYLHFDLLRLFSPQYKQGVQAQGIPYTKIYEALVTPFSTVPEVYELIINDLKEAEILLEEDKNLMVFPRKFVLNDGFTTARELHFNLYAAQALLARVYWMKGDLKSAALYAKKVIESGVFPLEDKLKLRNFVAGTINSKESIWGVYSTRTLAGIQKAFYTYERTLTWLPANDNLALYSVSPDQGNDMRGNDWFRILLGDNESDRIVRCMKIVNEEKIRDPGKYVSNAKEGINLIRVAEMYLIMAESLLQDDPVSAQNYFNTFIVSRGLFKYEDRIGNPKVDINDIYKERKKEFVQEGQQFYLLKRNNSDIYVDVLKSTLKGNDKLYTFIIPDEEFEFRYTEKDGN